MNCPTPTTIRGQDLAAVADVAPIRVAEFRQLGRANDRGRGASTNGQHLLDQFTRFGQYGILCRPMRVERTTQSQRTLKRRAGMNFGLDFYGLVTPDGSSFPADSKQTPSKNGLITLSPDKRDPPPGCGSLSCHVLAKTGPLPECRRVRRTARIPRGHRLYCAAAPRSSVPRQLGGNDTINRQA